MDVNSFTTDGVIARDAELSFTPSGTAVTKFSLATHRWNVSRKEEETMFVNVVVWGNQAEYAGKSCTKGRHALISGELWNREYQKSDGTKGHSLELTARQLKVFDIAKREPKPEENADPLGDLDDHPF